MTFLPPDSTAFSKSVHKLWQRMNPCTLCPRNCKVYRGKGQVGFCGIADMPKVSSVGPHFGEENVLVGSGGSGTGTDWIVPQRGQRAFLPAAASGACIDLRQLRLEQWNLIVIKVPSLKMKAR